jgi:hypothetical protein
MKFCNPSRHNMRGVSFERFWSSWRANTDRRIATQLSCRHLLITKYRSSYCYTVVLSPPTDNQIQIVVLLHSCPVATADDQSALNLASCSAILDFPPDGRQMVSGFEIFYLYKGNISLSNAVLHISASCRRLQTPTVSNKQTVNGRIRFLHYTSCVKCKRYSVSHFADRDG